MISISSFLQFWRETAAELSVQADVLPVTIDNEMGSRIQKLRADSLTLFVFPPIAFAAGSRRDRFVEESKCVIFLMKKYTPQKVSSFEVLEETQPAIEEIKRRLVELSPCAPFSVDVSTIETAPETELYGTFAGWSVSFSAYVD